MARYTQSSGPIYFPTVCSTEVITAPTSPIKENIVIHEIEIGNSSGGDAACGWGYKLINADFKVGQWDDSEPASYTDDTTDAQSSATGDVALMTTTNNDGFVVQAAKPFNAVSIAVNTAASGGSPAYDYAYWNGSAWTSLTLIDTPDFGNTGTTVVSFAGPADWAALASTDAPVATDGLTSGYYAVRVRATTAPSSTAAVASSFVVVRLLDYIEKVGDGNAAIREYPGGKVIPSGRPVVPYCGTANAGNWVSFEYVKTP